MPEISIVQGDIAEADCEAVVNAANSHLWMGSGVAGAIKRKGGVEIEAEAVARGPIPIGAAVATGAGHLRARYVIHAAAMGPDLQTDALKIRDATSSALRVAEELGVRSVAFPALGTGVGGFSVADCARVMLDVVRHHRGEHVRAVMFVLFGPAAFQEFRTQSEGNVQP
ncbi:MAG TPA: macro domain-containing protein [Chloroflexota bacterium]|nr:macro domain-containing protein [Chloroflexota bacterium]